jgi:hypothetical protein
MTEDDVMVTLPPGFVAIKFPGYFWNLRTKRLYSIKSGMLKPIKPLSKSSAEYLFRKLPGCRGIPVYGVSVNGQSRYVFDRYLNSLHPVESEIPVV